MDSQPEPVPESTANSSSFVRALDRLPELINKDDVLKMIDVQVTTLDRLDCTNKSLVNCSNMAQSKLATTTKLYKKTAKQLSESKRDLDICYKKIIDLKAKIKAERPDLLQKSVEPSDSANDHDIES